VWLPNCLLLFGKQEKSPVQIVKLLVAQANCLLAEDYPLDTIGMPDREGRGEPSLPKKERKQGGLEVIQGGRDSQGSKGGGGEPPDGKQKQNDPGYKALRLQIETLLRSRRSMKSLSHPHTRKDLSGISRES
jgi:hypothetical protein